MNKKRFRPRGKHFHQQGHQGGGAGGHQGGFAHPGPVRSGTGIPGVRPFEEVRPDPAVLPADLDQAQVDELLAALPPTGRKAKPKPQSHTELQALPLAELYEVAEQEKVEGLEGKKRSDVIFELTSARLNKRVPVEAEGCVDSTMDGHFFLRVARNSYLSTTEDVFLPPSLVQRHGLRQGMTVKGALRPPRAGEKYFAMVSIELIDFHEPERVLTRTPFKELVPLYPEQRILLEGAGSNPLEMRVVDLVSPIGRGQRGLIVAPPRTGKTVLLQQIATSIVTNDPKVHLIILLVDERPEEVTDMERTIPGDRREVVSSTFDEPAARHLKVADMVINKARCLVEAGEHVAILLDSITRLARAANNEAPSNGKLLSGGMEATALQFPKRFFGSARNIEGGGSLTILGTALIETGSKMDELIFEEFKGTGNMELVLDRRLSDRRIFPAVDINRSGTRKEELLFTPEEMKRIYFLRKVLNDLDPVESMETLLQKMKRTQVNGQFLMSLGS